MIYRLSSFTYSTMKVLDLQRPAKMRYAITLRQFRQWRDAIEKKGGNFFYKHESIFRMTDFCEHVLTARNVFRENSYDPRKYLGEDEIFPQIFLFHIANINRPYHDIHCAFAHRKTLNRLRNYKCTSFTFCFPRLLP